MWICSDCRMLVTLDIAEPEMDDTGLCFVCPVCRCRNPLTALPRKSPDDPLELEQLRY